jgi:hypothetical protein
MIPYLGICTWSLILPKYNKLFNVFLIGTACINQEIDLLWIGIINKSYISVKLVWFYGLVGQELGDRELRRAFRVYFLSFLSFLLMYLYLHTCIYIKAQVYNFRGMRIANRKSRIGRDCEERRDGSIEWLFTLHLDLITVHIALCFVFFDMREKR